MPASSPEFNKPSWDHRERQGRVSPMVANQVPRPAILKTCFVFRIFVFLENRKQLKHIFGKLKNRFCLFFVCLICFYLLSFHFCLNCFSFCRPKTLFPNSFFVQRFVSNMSFKFLFKFFVFQECIGLSWG